MHLNYSLHTLLQVTKRTKDAILYRTDVTETLHNEPKSSWSHCRKLPLCCVVCSKKKLIVGNAIRDSTLINHTPDNTQYDKGTVEGAGVYIIDDALINSLFHVHFTHT